MSLAVNVLGTCCTFCMCITANVTATSHFYLENDTNTGSIWTTGSSSIVFKFRQDHICQLLA